MKNNDGCSIVDKLLRLILFYVDFDRARFYVMSPLRDTALLLYSVNRADGCSDIKDWSALKNISFHYHKFFCKEKDKYDPTDYRDIICKFWDQKTFFVDLKDLKNVPDEISQVHDSKNVLSIAMTMLDINGEEYFGHIALDRSSRLNYKIQSEDVDKINEVVDFLGDSIIKSVQDEIFDYQYDHFLKLTNEVLDNIKKRKNEDELLEDMLKGILKICDSIDIVQIKEIDLKEETYRYKALEVNELSEIKNDERRAIYGLINKVYNLGDSQEVTSQVVRTKKSIYVKNMYDAPKEFTQWFKKKLNSKKKLSNEDDLFEDARFIVSYRNNSEINIPLRYGSVCYGVIDAHGRRPYSINANVVKILNLAAPWISVILKKRELEEFIDETGIRKDIFWQSIKYGDKGEMTMFPDPNFDKMLKEGFIDVVLDENDIVESLSDMMHVSEYGKVAKTYEKDVKNIMWFRFAKVASYGVVGVSIFSVIVSLMGYNIINPILATTGIIFSPVFIFMSRIAELKYLKILRKSKQYANANYLNALSIIKNK